MHLQETPLNKDGQNQEKSNQRLSNLQQHRKSLFGSKYKHYIYWIAIFILICGIAELYAQIKLTKKAINYEKERAQEEIKMLTTLEQKLKKHQQIVSSKQSPTQKNANLIELKATYIQKQVMEEYHLKKTKFIKQVSEQRWGVVRDVEKAKISLLLGMNGDKFQYQNIQSQKQFDQLLRIEYKRLRKKYNFSLPQLPFCVVVPTLNNNQNFRNIYNLQSILRQNYSNFKVVILDDASTDLNYETLQQFIRQNPVAQKIHLVKNAKKMGALFNIHQAASKYCSSEDILLIVDGDDELLGINVFKVFNSVYTTKNLDVAYSNFIVLYHKKKQLRGGWSSGYTEEQKKKNIYRDDSTRMFPVRTFKVSTFLKINEKDFKTDKGQWFRSASDQTYCPQVLELSCGRNQYIDQYFYLVNKELGSNDMDIDPNLNYGIMNIVRRRKKYQCIK